jgi:general stress protein 26
MSSTETNDIRKLAELMKGIKFAMLTTADADGSMHSRPMATQQVEFDGDLWFFTGRSTHKVADIGREHHVNVSYASPDDMKYVSVSGRATLIDDRAKMAELWNPAYKAWFPDGLDDPDLALLKVEVDRAEYWDSPGNPVVRLVGFVKAMIGGGSESLGENKKIDL